VFVFAANTGVRKEVVVDVSKIIAVTAARIVERMADVFLPSYTYAVLPVISFIGAWFNFFVTKLVNNLFVFLIGNYVDIVNIGEI
jgi:hypothetical protein